MDAPVNYQAHLDEAIADTETFSRANVRKIQETGLFLKATSSLATADELGDPHELDLSRDVDGEMRQRANTETSSWMSRN